MEFALVPLFVAVFAWLFQTKAFDNGRERNSIGNIAAARWQGVGLAALAVLSVMSIVFLAQNLRWTCAG